MSTDSSMEFSFPDSMAILHGFTQWEVALRSSFLRSSYFSKRRHSNASGQHVFSCRFSQTELDLSSYSAVAPSRQLLYTAIIIANGSAASMSRYNGLSITELQQGFYTTLLLLLVLQVRERLTLLQHIHILPQISTLGSSF